MNAYISSSKIVPVHYVTIYHSKLVVVYCYFICRVRHLLSVVYLLISAVKMSLIFLYKIFAWFLSLF